MKEQLFKMINDCYQTGDLPNDYMKSRIITILKKGKAVEYSNHRILSVLSHGPKLLINLFENRPRNQRSNDGPEYVT